MCTVLNCCRSLRSLSLPEGRANSLCDLETVTDTDHGSGFFCGSFDSKGGITTSSVGQIMSPGYTPLGLENQSAPAVFATSSLDGVTLYASKLGSRTGKAPGVRSTEKCMKRRSRTMLKRMDAETFLNHRRREEQEGRGGVIPRGWSKMAIVRVHRRDRPTVRYALWLLGGNTRQLKGEGMLSLFSCGQRPIYPGACSAIRASPPRHS